MHGRDRLLALVVVVLWGVNFPATAYALHHFPPFLAATLRFVLLSIPAVLFVPRPQVPLRWLIGTGLGLGVLQFGFLYLGMATGMPSGLASVVLQSSAPFTLVLAAVFLGERLSARALVGVAVAVCGLAVIGWHRATVAAFVPVALTVAAGFGWAIGNLSSRQARAPKPLHLTMWMSLVPLVPLGLLSWVVEGPERIGHALSTAFTRGALPADLGLLYIVVCASVVGYGIWNTLLSRHPSSEVAPWSMLVPVVGLSSSWLAFGEVPAPAEWVGSALVVGGILYATLRRPAPNPSRVRAPVS